MSEAKAMADLACVCDILLAIARKGRTPDKAELAWALERRAAVEAFLLHEGYTDDKFSGAVRMMLARYADGDMGAAREALDRAAKEVDGG